MATSGSSIVSRSAAEIITSALRRTRVIPVRQSVSSIDLQTGIEALNNLVAELKADGWHLWKSAEYVLFMEQGKQNYKIGPSGDHAVLLDDLIQTAVTVALAGAETQMTVTSTAGFLGSDSQLAFDPTDSTADWTVVTASVAVAANILTITNSSGNGYAQYSVTTTATTEYFFELDITSVVGAVTLEVRSGLSGSLITSQAVTLDGTQVVHFTALEESTVIRIVNDNASGDTDVDNFLFKETDTGESVGFKSSNALREWNTVTRVISSTVLELKNVVVNTATANQTVLAYKAKPPRPMKINNQRSKNVLFDSEIPITAWSRQQYMQQTTKESTGLPTQAYYNPELTDGRLYIWQTACDVNQIIMFTGDRPLEVFVETSDSPDFPSEWFNMLSWGLASELGPEYGISAKRQAVVDQKAMVARDRAEGWDEESGSLLIGPDNLGKQ